ncbi:hypothetical protein [Paenibacillus abyssi]|uniref:Uncharacterized protein n=1 Tax=Paenibacillus abyssi TaxID=1340531 RepID=A0A917FNE9_9BACL|nr:hypothetical protein [Paenibacillus abyssi]GGF91446.1 hypothetical protein GCM10010916_05910 [Paenibacillus abyssi]
MKKIICLSHDPGGYDVVSPIALEMLSLGWPVQFYCIGPSAHLNPGQASTFEHVVEIIENEIAANDLSLVITGTSWGSDAEIRIIARCKKENIKTMSILDYWTNYISRFKASNSAQVYPDYYIVMDELAKREAIQEGVPEEILYALGQPGLDKFIRNRITAAPPAGNKILFLSQPLSYLYGDSLGYTEQQVLNDCLAIFSSHKQYDFHIKFHPKETPHIPQAYIQEAVQLDGNLNGLIPNYDYVISMNSMGLLHAALQGKCAISYQPNLAMPDVCISNKLGLSELITSFDWLKHRISNLNNKEQKSIEKSVDSYIWMDGHSTERIVSFIRGVI